MTPTTRRRLLAGLGAGTIGLAGCQARTDGGTTPVSPGATATEPTGGDGVHYTFGDASGRRFVPGSGAVSGATPVDVSLSGRPNWILGAGVDDGSLWVVASDEGTVEAVLLADDGSVARVDPGVDVLPAGTPPVLDARNRPRVLAHPEAAGADTHPTVVGDATCYVTPDGTLVIDRGGGETERLAVDALPDGRVVAADGLAYVPAEPSDRYRHGALGDATEPTAVAVVDPGEGVVGRVAPPDESVFEALVPAVGEDPPLAITEATSPDGARIATYDRGESGRIAAGPRVSANAGWTHRVAVGPLGPGGETEVAAVEKPHVEHELHFLRREEDILRVAASADGYQSHTLGDPRNTSRVRAGDFDGDGRPEILLPQTGQERLDGVVHADSGAEVAYTLAVGGELVTNLATARRDGGIGVAAGREDGVLRVWRA